MGKQKVIQDDVEISVDTVEDNNDVLDGEIIENPEITKRNSVNSIEINANAISVRFKRDMDFYHGDKRYTFLKNDKEKISKELYLILIKNPNNIEILAF